MKVVGEVRRRMDEFQRLADIHERPRAPVHHHQSATVLPLSDLLSGYLHVAGKFSLSHELRNGLVLFLVIPAK